MGGEGADIPTVARISPEHRLLEAPEFLKSFQGFCIWRYEPNPGKPKPRKVPYWSGGGRRYLKHGSPEDREKLTSFAAARDAAIRRGFDGVGFALLPEWHITALDFDNVVGPNGEITPEIMAIVSKTYAEYSPSGNGVRAFFKGDLGSHSARPSGDDCEFSTYNTSGFVTITAQPLPITEAMGFENHIAEVDDNLRSYCLRRFGPTINRERSSDDPFAGHEPRLGLTPEQIEETLAKLDPNMGRDDWIRVGMGVHHECEGDETGLDLWDEWSCVADNYVSRHDLESQWGGFTRRMDSGVSQVTMRSVLKMVRDLDQTVSTEDLGEVAREAALLADPVTVNTPDDYDGKFPIHTAAKLASQPPTDWLIKGVIPRADILMLFGASTSGKSFISIDLSGAIARGVPWRGRRVRKGRVLIIAAEGAGGMGKRLAAYCKVHKIDPETLEVGVITVQPNLMEKGDVKELARSIAAAGGFDLLVVDTYAQVTPGANENSGEDMGRALANARALREATGATILLIHHAGKDASKGARGWSGNKAAVDAEIEITRSTEDDDRQIHISKMKDGEDGLRIGFRLETVALGLDQDDDLITSCVTRSSGIERFPFA